MIFSPVYYREDVLDESFEMLSITTEDGVELEGVVFNPEIQKATILFFAGRSHDAVGLIKRLSQTFPHAKIITFNYRSYGKSGGVASEKNLFKDGVLVAEMVQKHYGDFYILGFSIGSSVSTYVASKVDSLGLFLVGSFDSIASVAKEKFVSRGNFPMIDLSAVFRYKFDNKTHVQNVDVPTYLFVSQADETTYIQNARKLKDKIKNLAFYKEFEDLKHKEILWHDEVLKKINEEIK